MSGLVPCRVIDKNTLADFIILGFDFTLLTSAFVAVRGRTLWTFGGLVCWFRVLVLGFRVCNLGSEIWVSAFAV